ncbi:MAG: heterodisulfide reductase-related iron-sulfur binding cluster [Thermoproteota archaeon]
MSCLYSLFLGCIVPNIFPEVERAVRDALSRLDIEFMDIKGAACCLPPALFGFNKDAWLKINLRNFGLAGGDLLTICDECFASLQDSKVSIEKEGGKALPNVLPLVKVLKDVEGTIKEHVKRSLNLRCAIQHSCHLLRPSKVRGIDDPESPKQVRSLLEILGCEYVGQEDELGCCGGSIYGGSEISRKLAIRRIGSAKNSRADLIVTTCSHCLKHLRAYSKNLPVLHLAQLCALALGSDPSEIGTGGILR